VALRFGCQLQRLQVQRTRAAGEEVQQKALPVAILVERQPGVCALPCPVRSGARGIVV
jgi:hypothetical protein